MRGQQQERWRGQQALRVAIGETAVKRVAGGGWVAVPMETGEGSAAQQERWHRQQAVAPDGGTGKRDGGAAEGAEGGGNKLR